MNYADACKKSVISRAVVGLLNRHLLEKKLTDLSKGARVCADQIWGNLFTLKLFPLSYLMKKDELQHSLKMNVNYWIYY